MLAVRGATWLREDGSWGAGEKAPDPEIDGWYGRWYDATGNCVSGDRAAGFPVAVQWQHGPAMEDGTADGKILRVADGRAVYLTAGTGELLCRDAGNGTLLWSRQAGADQSSGMVVAAGRVHLWHDAAASRTGEAREFQERGVLCAFDLATGELVQRYEEGLEAGTASAIEWLGTDNRGRPRTLRRAPVPWFTVDDEVVVEAYGRHLVVLDRATGSKLWARRSPPGLTWFSPVVSDGRLVAYEARVPARRGRHDGSRHAPAISAFALRSGEPLWREEGFHREHEIEGKRRTYIGRASVKPLSLAGDRLLVQTASYQFRRGGSVAVYDARTGEERWYHRFEPKERYTQGSYRAVLRGDEVVLMCGRGIVRFSAGDGEVIEEIEPPRERREARRNGACTASRATEELLIANAYLWLGSGGRARTTFGARGACGQGVVPANGLVFVPPTGCDCGDYTRGYQALAPEMSGRGIDASRRLERGPARASPQRDAGWGHFLGGPARRSSTPESLPETLGEVWRAELGHETPDAVVDDRRWSERWLGALSAPTVAGDAVLVSLPERHEVAALSLEDGTLRWRRPTRGKVDSPPTLASGLVVYGSERGFVTARSVRDGALAWRFRAMPTDGVVLHHGHFASPHPIPGSVLVLGDHVIAAAGQHTDLGGLHLWSLELETGEVVGRRVLDANEPSVISNGILVADLDGEGFWLGSPESHRHFSPGLEDLPAEGDVPAPPVRFDRNGTRIRFRTAEGRGGSTHGWKQAMRSTIGGLRAHRIAIGDRSAYALQDPTSRMHHEANAGKTATLVAARGTRRDREALWAVSQAALGNPESLGALVHAAVSGGRRWRTQRGWSTLRRPVGRAPGGVPSNSKARSLQFPLSYDTLESAEQLGGEHVGLLVRLRYGHLPHFDGFC